MLEIIYDRCLGLPNFTVNIDECHHDDLEGIIRRHMQLHLHQRHNLLFYTLHNGKKVNNPHVVEGVVNVIPCLPGGKGGFGSMLRAIGAQIEKTTNREACRDLSGRRLRDINEEKRLKKWIAEQADREREAAEKKKRKLSKLCVEPKHEFSDPNYDKARSEMVDNIHNAVEEGLKTGQSVAEPSTSNGKDVKMNKKKKKVKGSVWIDDLDELDDDSEENGVESEEEETPKKKLKVS